MLKTFIVAMGLAMAGLFMAPQGASAANLGANQADVATFAPATAEQAQYYGPRYGGRRGYGARRYYGGGPRFYGPRRYYGGPRFYGPRPYGPRPYGPRRFYYGY